MEKADSVITVLRKEAIIPGREEVMLDCWTREVKLRQKYGYTVLNAFIETGKGMQYRLREQKLSSSGDEKILTWLYSYEGDIEAAEDRLAGDSEMLEIAKIAQENTVSTKCWKRNVDQRIMHPATEDSMSKMVIMRRYNITGDWEEFLGIWKRIVPVREKYGFPCLFAVEDVAAREFDWAFTYDGDDFEVFMREGQKGYYSDPQRVELETVNNYLEEIRLTPARQLPIP